MAQDADPRDLDTFNRFASRDEEEGRGTNLADLILEKIAAHEATQGGQAGHPVILGGGAPEDAVELNSKVVQVYSTYVPCPQLVSGTQLTLRQDRIAPLTIQVR